MKKTFSKQLDKPRLLDLDAEPLGDLIAGQWERSVRSQLKAIVVDRFSKRSEKRTGSRMRIPIHDASSYSTRICLRTD